MQLLTTGTNAKTIKSDSGGVYRTAILYLAPATQAGRINICPLSAAAQCRTACLYTAGRGRMNSVQRARIRKTVFYRDKRSQFIDTLHQDIEQFKRQCARAGVIPAIRLNGTSDIPWERYGVPQQHPEIQFYDYTKQSARLENLPANYHMTLSYSAADLMYGAGILDAGRRYNANIAVVFRDRLPPYFNDTPVIDGNAHDLRFTDPNGVIVGLTAKGPAKQDKTGFVVDWETAA